MCSAYLSPFQYFHLNLSDFYLPTLYFLFYICLHLYYTTITVVNCLKGALGEFTSICQMLWDFQLKLWIIVILDKDPFHIYIKNIKMHMSEIWNVTNNDKGAVQTVQLQCDAQAYRTSHAQLSMNIYFLLRQYFSQEATSVWSCFTYA